MPAIRNLIPVSPILGKAPARSSKASHEVRASARSRSRVAAVANVCPRAWCQMSRHHAPTTITSLD